MVAPLSKQRNRHIHRALVEAVWLRIQPVSLSTVRSSDTYDVQATAARLSQETVAAQQMITRFSQRRGCSPASVAADATYGNGEFLQWLLDRGITLTCAPRQRS